MYAVQLLVFATAWVGIIYAFNSWFANKLPRPKVRPMFLYIVTTAALGVLGEMVFDTVYQLVIGRPLWEYHVLPIHDGYTSVYSLFLWGAVGFHVYLLHGTLQARGIVSLHKLAGVFCVEAIVLEALVNLTFLGAVGGYIYYYNPTDLWHITSVQTLPLYLLAGYITLATLRFAGRTPVAATAGSAVVALGLVGIGVLGGR